MKTKHFNFFSALLLLSIFNLQTPKQVFFICHSHDDLGWLSTIQEYYRDQVKYILDSIIQAISDSSSNQTLHKKFQYSEIGNIKLYLNDEPSLTQSKKDAINSLIKNKKWEFVNGGISQPDEACSNYHDIINNYFYGLRYIQSNFNATTHILWQLDPFGHSKAFFYLASKFGMKHGVVTRIDHDLRNEMGRSKNMEFIYKLPENRELIVHVSTNYHQNPPPGCENNPDYRQTIYNDDFSPEWSEDMYQESSYIMIGDDFEWRYPNNFYSNIDPLIKNCPRFKYALFSEYAQNFDENIDRPKLKIFEDDFFVYSQQIASGFQSWSGYFSTKPLLKYRISRIGIVLRNISAFIAYFFLTEERNLANKKSIESLVDICEEAALLIHHDTITGTSTYRVDSDYFQRILDIELRLHVILANNLNDDKIPYFCDINLSISQSNNQCSYFPALLNNRDINFVVFNNDFYPKSKIFRISVPVLSKNKGIFLEDENQQIVQTFIICLSVVPFCHLYFFDTLSENLQKEYKLNIVDMPFESNFPETDISLIESKSKTSNADFETIHIVEDNVILTFSNFIVEISQNLIKYMCSIEKQENLISYLYMLANKSGHYVLDYNGQLSQMNYTQFISYKIIKTEFMEGVIVEGTRITMILTKEKDKPHYSIQTLVLNDPIFFLGVHVLLKITSTPISNPKNEFYTDSNGLFEMKRNLGKTFERGVFPITRFVKILDENNKSGLKVFTDRAQGAYAYDNAVFIYLQRSSSVSDEKGNNEILSVNENVFLNHIVYNFIPGSEKISDETDQILNEIDRYDFILFGEDLKSFFKKNNEHQNKSPILPKAVKITYQFISEVKLILRFQNTFVFELFEVDLEKWLIYQYPKRRFQEVEFEYVWEGSGKEEPLKKVYRINPLEFVTILATVKND